MLKDCIEVFQAYAGEDIDKLIIDNYVPADGLYIIMEETKEGFIETEQIEVKQDLKTKEIKLSQMQFAKISELDYSCRLVDMNKPIDSSKIIQSNNYLSFWIKKESLTNGKLTYEIIDNYYKVLMDPALKYAKSKKDMELYQLVEKRIGSVDKDKLLKVKDWIKEHIFEFSDKVAGKDYLKIFFLCDGIDVKKEGERYLLPNIYNKNDYNVLLGEEIYGLPNENMGLNAKKPYLESKNRKYAVPILTNTDEILLRKKFFDYLWALASKRKYNIYFDAQRNEIIPLDGQSAPNRDMYGYFLRIRKDKNEAAIVDEDIITRYRTKLKKPFIFSNILGVNTAYMSGHHYGRHSDLESLRMVIHEELFSKYLLGNLYQEEKEISCNNDQVLYENILRSRKRLMKWLFLGDENGIYPLLHQVCFSLIKNSMNHQNMIKAQHQFNLYLSIQQYFIGGEEDMAQVMNEIRETIYEKMNRDLKNQKDSVNVETDQEYYYAVGQLVGYFLSLNRATKKTHALFNPFLTIKKDEVLKEKIKVLFLKYSYAIEQGGRRFKNLYSMVLNYEPKGECDHTYLLAGYISNNLVYEKKEDK